MCWVNELTPSSWAILSSGHATGITILFKAALIPSTDPPNVGLVFQLYLILPELLVVSEVLECTAILEGGFIYATFRKLSAMLGWNILEMKWYRDHFRACDSLVIGLWAQWTHWCYKPVLGGLFLWPAISTLLGVNRPLFTLQVNTAPAHRLHILFTERYPRKWVGEWNERKAWCMV